jgi:hypothetical protein
MSSRALETGLARFTLGMLLIYAPVETWASLPDGLLNPFYLVDFIAMVLLFAGAVVSLRARPLRSPGLLCAAYGWTAANGWRATFGRVAEIERGGALAHGTAEMWTVAIGSALALAGFAVLLYLVAKAPAAATYRKAE